MSDPLYPLYTLYTANGGIVEPRNIPLKEIYRVIRQHPGHNFTIRQTNNTKTNRDIFSKRSLNVPRGHLGDFTPPSHTNTAPEDYSKATTDNYWVWVSENSRFSNSQVFKEAFTSMRQLKKEGL